MMDSESECESNSEISIPSEIRNIADATNDELLSMLRRKSTSSLSKI